MRIGLTISGALLVVLMLGMLWLLERRARLNLQAVGEDAPRRLQLLAAAAEHPDFVRSWVRPTVLCLVGLLGGQLLNLAGCNSTPTQTRRTNLENRVAEQGSTIVPRRNSPIGSTSSSSCRPSGTSGLTSLKRKYDRVADELMQRSR